MKDIDKLIESLSKKVEMYLSQSDRHDFNEGIAKGISIALEEIKRTNTDLNKKIYDLL